MEKWQRRSSLAKGAREARSRPQHPGFTLNISRLVSRMALACQALRAAAARTTPEGWRRTTGHRAGIRCCGDEGRPLPPKGGDSSEAGGRRGQRCQGRDKGCTQESPGLSPPRALKGLLSQRPGPGPASRRAHLGQAPPRPSGSGAPARLGGGGSGGGMATRAKRPAPGPPEPGGDEPDSGSDSDSEEEKLPEVTGESRGPPRALPRTPFRLLLSLFLPPFPFFPFSPLLTWSLCHLRPAPVGMRRAPRLYLSFLVLKEKEEGGGGSATLLSFTKCFKRPELGPGSLGTSLPSSLSTA